MHQDASERSGHGHAKVYQPAGNRCDRKREHPADHLRATIGHQIEAAYDTYYPQYIYANSANAMEAVRDSEQALPVVASAT